MKTGLKVWLWFVLIVNALGLIVNTICALVVAIYWISVLAGAVAIVGIATMLFARKRSGFYIICAGQVIGIAGAVLAGGSLISSLSATALNLGIIWILSKSSWSGMA